MEACVRDLQVFPRDKAVSFRLTNRPSQPKKLAPIAATQTFEPRLLPDESPLA